MGIVRLAPFLLVQFLEGKTHKVPWEELPSRCSFLSNRQRAEQLELLELFIEVLNGYLAGLFRSVQPLDLLELPDVLQHPLHCLVVPQQLLPRFQRETQECRAEFLGEVEVLDEAYQRRAEEVLGARLYTGEDKF